MIIDGDPRAADQQLAAIARVTAADVQRVARKYLGDNRSATIRYLPARRKPAGASGDTIAVAADGAGRRRSTPPANVAIVTPAPARPSASRRPPRPQPVAATLPAPVETRLANGMR